MTSILVWSVCAFAFSWVLADSKISYPLRTWLANKARGGPVTFSKVAASFFLSLLECVACTSFHVGWIAQLAGVTPFHAWWMAALFTCGSSLLLAKYVGMLDERE